MTTTERTGPVIVRLHVGASFTTASATDTLEIDRDEWDVMIPADRRALLDDHAGVMRDNAIDSGWQIEDPDDYADTEDDDEPAATAKPSPVDVDDVLRLVEDYGSKRVAAATALGRGNPGTLRAITGEAAAVLEQIRAAVTR